MVASMSQVAARSSPASSNISPQATPQQKSVELPSQAVAQLERNVDKAQAAVLQVQRLALLGQLSSTIAQLVVEEDDARKIIVTAREVAVSPFVPLDPQRLERSKMEAQEHDSRSVIANKEFSEHLVLLKAEQAKTKELVAQLRVEFIATLVRLDRQATFGVLQLLAASQCDLEFYKLDMTKQGARVEAISKKRRAIEDYEAETRSALQSNALVRFSAVVRRFKAQEKDLLPVQQAYVAQLDAQRRAEEQARHEAVLRAAAVARADRMAAERRMLEEDESIARRTALAIERTAWEDLERLARFQRTRL